MMRDEPALANNGDITDLSEGNSTSQFDLKEKIAGQTDNNGTENVEIMVLLKYLSNFWRARKILLVNFEISLDLNWSENSVIFATNKATQATIFSIFDAKFYVLIVTLSAQNNLKLLKQLKFGF